MSSDAIIGTSDLKVGDKVFAVITPNTPHIFSQHYHPRPYFVLETTVKEAWPGETWRRFKYSTRFFVGPGRAFRDLQAAAEKLAEVFAKETGGTIQLENVMSVSEEEEKHMNERITTNIWEAATNNRPYTYLAGGPIG